MTEKPTMPDGEGPGDRVQRAKNRRWLVFQGLYAAVAIPLTIGLIMGRRDPTADGLPLTPEAGVAGAVLLPLLTLVTMWFALRMTDEVQRRVIIDAWAAGLIVTALSALSWLFLVGGGVLPEPPGQVVLLTVLGGSTAAVLVAVMWLRWRRIGDVGLL